MKTLGVVALSSVALGGFVGCSAGSDADASHDVPGSCFPPYQQCPGGCVDVSSNVLSCGLCGLACAPGDLCIGGMCQHGCNAGLVPCAGQCVDLASTAGHCGACDRACAPGQVCVGGACTSNCNGTVCQGPGGAQCVTLSTDPNHCGACNAGCGPGRRCVGSACVLDCGSLTDCAGACVDLQSDAANCGACGMVCGADRTCAAGACACAPGRVACGEACVDTAVDPAHCGACERACGAGHLCEGGECVGPDGCTDTPVTDLALTAVDAYQSVQIRIANEGTAVGPGARNADLVVGRSAVFRVHVTPEAGWAPRQVSARIDLTDVDMPDPTQKETFFAVLTPTVASSDADLGSTFQVHVPAEAIGPTTRYAVTLVECDGAPAAAPPSATRARFPSDGFEPLAARETGPLKVHIVPISGTNVTEAGLEPFKQRLEAVYPITQVEFTIGESLTATASSMCSLLASVTSRRSQDNPPNDVYYFGLTPGILGGQSGCSNASTGPRSSKVSAGWAQGFTPDDGRTGAATMCHELGHAHGRLHAPCNVQDPDPRYPYPRADIGVWGYDRRSDEFYEPTRQDMMSYCPEPRWAAWISDYTYQAILERTIQVNAQPEVQAFLDASGPPVSWRLLVSDSSGVHWIDEPLIVRGTPDGTPTSAVVHGAQGAMQPVVVYEQDLEDGVSDGAFMLAVPEPDPSWRGIEVPGFMGLQPF